MVFYGSVVLGKDLITHTNSCSRSPDVKSHIIPWNVCCPARFFSITNQCGQDTEKSHRIKSKQQDALEIEQTNGRRIKKEIKSIVLRRNVCRSQGSEMCDDRIR